MPESIANQAHATYVFLGTQVEHVQDSGDGRIPLCAFREPLDRSIELEVVQNLNMYGKRRCGILYIRI
jgi:hypothetical protein